jgi:hypothetical protein
MSERLSLKALGEHGGKVTAESSAEERPSKGTRRRATSVGNHNRSTSEEGEGTTARSPRKRKPVRGTEDNGRPTGPSITSSEKAALLEAAERAARDVAQEAAREAASRAAWDIAQNLAREAAAQTARDVAQDTARDVAEDVARDVAQDTARNAAREVAAQASSEAAPKVDGRRSLLGRLAKPISTLWALIAVIASTVLSTFATSVFVHDVPAKNIADSILNKGDPPIEVLSILERDYGAQGQTWALREKVGSLDRSEETLLATASRFQDEFQKWVRSRGGIDVDSSYIKLVVTGRRYAKVLITDMHVRVVQRSKPVAGTLFYAPPEGDSTTSLIGFDLDESIPVARTIDPSKKVGNPGYLGKPYFRENTVTLTEGEQHIFNVVAATKNCHCVWNIELDIIADNRAQKIIAGLPEANGGNDKPFETTARADSRSHEKGNFAVYEELYVWDGERIAGFAHQDPRLYRDG